MHEHNYVLSDDKLSKNENRTTIVVVLTFVTMFVEVFYGYLTGSMALLADGWHMGSHVGALGISVLVYKLARSKKFNSRLSFGAGKLIPLGGYTSALLLGLVAVFMIVESLGRFIKPESIDYDMAIFVSIAGLVVNFLSALILWNGGDNHHHHDHHHHDHDHDHEHEHDHDHDHVHDHNHEGAFMHVVADAFTSILAIIALLLGKHFSWNWADPLMGIVGALVILKWSKGLMQNTLFELLDAQVKKIKRSDIEKILSGSHRVELVDFHYWRIAPNAYACELVLCSEKIKGANYYRDLILKKYSIEHLVIEENSF